jgi:hypothetical protein
MLFLGSLASFASADLIAHYKFDSSSGLVAIDSVAGNNGTIKNWNDPAGGPQGSWVTGAPGFGNAYNFNGTDSSNTPLAALDGLDQAGANPTQVTVAYWKKGNNLPNDDTYPYAEDFMVSGMNLHSWAYWNPHLGSGLVYQNAVAGSGYSDQIGGGIPSPETTLNEWHHYALTKDAETGNMKTYIDGIIIGNAAGFIATFDKPVKFDIGSSIWGGQCLDGAIDDFRIYNTALTDNEVFDLMTPSVATGVTGDYNGNDVVDAADYTLFRDNLGSDSSVLQNNDIPGTITSDHYDQWKDRFGNSATASRAGTPIPEPMSLSLLFSGLILAIAYRLR